MSTSDHYLREAEDCRAQAEVTRKHDYDERLSRLRARASRLFALAVNARQLGIQAYGLALTVLAGYVSAQAEELERRRQVDRRSRHGEAQ